MTSNSETLEFGVEDSRVCGTVLTPESKVPGVLFLHGWGGSQEQDLTKAADIAALGCVCFTFDMRGHARWESQRDTVTREDNLKDVIAAYDELVRQPGVDASAVAVVGSSYGGYLAAILTTLRPVRWLALRVPALYRDADWDRPKALLDRRDLMLYRSNPVPIDDNRALRACSTFAGDVLIVESQHDEIVPHATITSFVAAFPTAHSLTYRIVAGADHALSSDPCRKAYNSLLVNWVTEMVLGARRG
jgi:pimeloyl-ACP methyl ester carboxylesterase